ncbi:F-box/LRR-repeat protein At3g59200-like [Cornus florida]|uniref:F-box/LRR-repeat protein At3g59200-like n=1 Tax=Cornus florida TaxID=4283 RepID=UPI00289B4EE0|nr:F-box/LRR-repeat protein At3g59200-like [Cornus florida]
MVPGEGHAGAQDETSSEFRQVNSVECEELVASRGLDYEEGSWPSLHKLVGSWSRSPDETKQMGSILESGWVHSEEVNVGGYKDMISNLPTCLIGHILSFLPTKNAVATSVLSTKWKYLWTSITNLDFDDGLLYASATPWKGNEQRQSLVEKSFVNFVYHVRSRNVSNLHKFRLRCTRSYDVSHVNAWVSTALSRNPRELHLSKTGSLPHELFTLVCLQSLKILVIDSLKFSDDDSFYRLFSSCPVLEDLSIENCDLGNISVFNISAPNLKSLTMNCGTWLNETCSHTSKYKIVLNTPNLQDPKYKDAIA